jgi:methane/ammonia monooxygenase subunit B
MKTIRHIRLASWGAYALALLMSVAGPLYSPTADAHGERAQQASLRMRTMHWFDTDIQPRKIAVNETIRVTGRFMPSKSWPEHIRSVEEAAFLNIGVPGPAFVRIDSRVNGVPMIRSTRFHLGETYEYEIVLKGRAPGRYHVHPVVSVEGAGPIIGPAFWVEVSGDQNDFQHTITTMTGETINPETYALSTILWWNALWFVIGIAWMAWWFRKLPVIMPRYIKVQDLGDDQANQLITIPDMIVSVLFVGFVMMVIAGGFFWANYKYPITAVLQTGKVEVEPLPMPPQKVEVEVNKATYRIPGRSFQVEMTVTNRSDRPVQVGEFSAANIRFINDKMFDIKPQDEHDLVASSGLRVESAAIKPGETRTITIYADDALWETYRLVSLINEPDGRFAALLMFYDDEGTRYLNEIQGPMIPSFG